MSQKMRIKVSENYKVIARFESTGDAMRFAEIITLGTNRELYVSDIKGWIGLTYTNGYTIDIP